MIILTQPPVLAYDDDQPIPFRIASFDGGDSVPKTCSVPARNTSMQRTPSSVKASEGVRTVSRLASTTPWELTRRKTRTQLRRTQSRLEPPMNIFRTLPREVYECILQQLEWMYLGRGGQSCSECYVRDLYSLCLTSRSWDRVANPRMYRDLWVLGCNDVAFHAKIKILGTSRLKLLRRTLRERPSLAQLVRNLYLPDLQDLYHNASIEREEIVNLVASLVMVCPKLERLIGFHVPYRHAHDRLSYALSTRPNLKERVWFFSDDEGGISEDHFEDDPSLDYYQAATDPTEHFLELNSNHSDLTSLVLHQDCHRAPRELNFRAIIGTLRQFPKLRDLCISGLSRTAFSNFALNALPPNLLSLRLENLPGINDTGIERFSKSRSIKSLESITLINLEISRLDIICNFLHPRLSHLQRFTLAQHQTPLVPATGGRPSRPQFHSPTLRQLHWEIRSLAGPPPTPTTLDKTSPEIDPIEHFTHLLLANSIRKGTSFPSLQRIRVPHDPDGLIQAQCKPLLSALLPLDTHLFPTSPHPRTPHHPLSPPQTPKSTSSTHSSSDDRHTAKNTTALPSELNKPFPPSSIQEQSNTYPLPSHSPQFPDITSLTPTRSRLAAQSRILAAPGVYGEVQGRVVYQVRSDREEKGLIRGIGHDEEGCYRGTDEWVVGVEDLIGRFEGGCANYHDGNGSEAKGMCAFGRRRKDGCGRGGVVRVGDLF